MYTIFTVNVDICVRVYQIIYEHSVYYVHITDQIIATQLYILYYIINMK